MEIYDISFKKIVCVPKPIILYHDLPITQSSQFTFYQCHCDLATHRDAICQWMSLESPSHFIVATFC